MKYFELFFISVFMSGSAFAEVARIGFLKGEVTVNKRIATAGQDLAVGDKVETSSGKCTLLFGGKHIVHLGPNALLTVSQEKNPEGVTRPSANLEMGSVRALVQKTGDKGTKFTIRTRSATMGVRGTHVFVSTGAQDRFVTLSGAAEVTQKGAVTSTPLGAGQIIGSSSGGAMAAPKKLPVSEVARLAVAIVPPPKAAKSLKDVDKLSSDPNSAFESDSGEKSTMEKRTTGVKLDPIADNRARFHITAKMKAFR